MFFCQKLAVREGSGMRKNSPDTDLSDQYIWINRTDVQYNGHQHKKKSQSLITTQISSSAFLVCLQISLWTHDTAIIIKDLSDLLNTLVSNKKNYVLWALLINKNITRGSVLYRLMTNRLFELSLLHAIFRYSMLAFALSVTHTASLSNLVQSTYF